MIVENSIATVIKDMRKQRLLTQKDLASKIGVSVMTIKFWETGRLKPSTKNLKKLAKGLHCKLETLTDCL